MENRTLGPTKSIPPCSKNLELVFWVLNGTAGVIILSGNFITILVLVTNRRLRQNYVNIFLVNLAVADLMMAVFVIPGYAVFCNGCNKNAFSKHCSVFPSLRMGLYFLIQEGYFLNSKRKKRYLRLLHLFAS